MIEPSPSKEPFHAILCRVVQNRTQEMRSSTPMLVASLGPDYRTFMYWLEGQRKFPAELLPKLCLELGDFELLDVLEHEVGRVAFRVPEITQIHSIDDVRVVQRLVREVGEALNELAKTLEDGIVEKHELDKTVSELNDVIRECAHLKRWLEERHRADFKKITPARRSR